LKSKELAKALLELKSSSLKIDAMKTEEEIRSMFRKYDMLFLGKNFNTIFSIELRHCLKEYFKVELSNEELNELIPKTCDSLNMDYEPMVEVENPSSPVPHAYRIVLW
jgi:hypothetical protein